MKMIRLRDLIDQAEERHKACVKNIRRDAWKLMYLNEIAAVLERNGLTNVHVGEGLSWVFASAVGGCEQVMRTIAVLEGHGWEFDYDEIMHDGGDYIDAQIEKPFGFKIGFNIADAANCRIIEEESYEMERKVKRTVVCG